MTGHYSSRVSPFGHSRINASVQLPWTFRRFRALHRQLVPRHSPCTLCSLRISRFIECSICFFNQPLCNFQRTRFAVVATASLSLGFSRVDDQIWYQRPGLLSRPCEDFFGRPDPSAHPRRLFIFGGPSHQRSVVPTPPWFRPFHWYRLNQQPCSEQSQIKAAGEFPHFIPLPPAGPLGKGGGNEGPLVVVPTPCWPTRFPLRRNDGDEARMKPAAELPGLTALHGWRVFR